MLSGSQTRASSGLEVLFFWMCQDQERLKPRRFNLTWRCRFPTTPNRDDLTQGMPWLLGSFGRWSILRAELFWSKLLGKVQVWEHGTGGKKVHGCCKADGHLDLLHHLHLTSWDWPWHHQRRLHVLLTCWPLWTQLVSGTCPEQEAIREWGCGRIFVFNAPVYGCVVCWIPFLNSCV